MSQDVDYYILLCKTFYYQVVYLKSVFTANMGLYEPFSIQIISIKKRSVSKTYTHIMQLSLTHY